MLLLKFSYAKSLGYFSSAAKPYRKIMMLSKYFLPPLRIICVTAFVGALNSVTSPVFAEITLEARVEQLEAAVRTLESELASLRAAPASLSSVPTPDELNPTNLVLRHWSFREVQVKFNTFHALDLTFYNGYPKNIREIDARLDFKDLLGEHMYSVRISVSEEIPAHSDIIDQGTATNRRLFGKGAVLEKISRQNVKAELYLRRIVFTDGSVESF
jgi:hypothetical protein